MNYDPKSSFIQDLTQPPIRKNNLSKFDDAFRNPDMLKSLDFAELVYGLESLRRDVTTIMIQLENWNKGQGAPGWDDGWHHRASRALQFKNQAISAVKTEIASRQKEHHVSPQTEAEAFRKMALDILDGETYNRIIQEARLEYPEAFITPLRI